MPKDNIMRAINKSEINKNENFENLRYEGFGPKKIALIIESLTDNKNRTASSIRTTLQKFGGSLGSTGSTKHFFDNCGIIQVSNKGISEDMAIDLAAKVGAKDCKFCSNFYEIVTKKEDFYKIKNEIEKLIKNLTYSAIEWRPKSPVKLKKEEAFELESMLELLEENDDIQSVFSNFEVDDSVLTSLTA